MSLISEDKHVDTIRSCEQVFFDRKVTAEEGSEDEIVDPKQARAWLDVFSLQEGLKGMDVLECGCGTGKFTAVLAEQGAAVKAFDISPESARITDRRVKRKGLGNVQVDVAAMEKLPYEDKSFDIVVGLLILHHLADLEKGVREVYRVLKPGGKALFYETSAGNPILMFLRRRLVGHWGIPKLGTQDEHPLTRADLRAVSAIFDGRMELSYPRFRFFRKLYFQLFRQSRIAKFLLEGVDTIIYHCFPFIRQYSYLVMIKLTR